MNDNLVAFLNFVKSHYELDSLDENKKKYFRDFLKQPDVTKRLIAFDSRLTLFFASKLDVKFEDVSAIDENNLRQVFENCVFEINRCNVDALSKVLGQQSGRFGFFEQKNVLDYIRRQGPNEFANAMVSLTDCCFVEKSSFLLKVLYFLDLVSNVVDSVIEKIDRFSIDYNDLLADEKKWKTILDIERDTFDEKCKRLLEMGRLRYTWTNLIVAANQLEPSDRNLLSFINDAVENHIDVLNVNRKILANSKSYAENFIQFAFTNDSINDRVYLEFFKLADKNRISVPDVLFVAYISRKDVSMSLEFRRWQVPKCAISLLPFVGAPFHVFARYAPLICWLVKKDVNAVLDMLEKKNPLFDNVMSEGIDENGFCVPRKRMVCIYASLLRNYIVSEEYPLVLDSEETNAVLERVDLELLDDVFDVWKNVYKEDSRDLIRNILSKKSAYYDKIFDSSKKGQENAIHFLCGLIGVAEEDWLREAYEKNMEKNGILIKSMEGHYMKNQLTKLDEYIKKLP